MGRPTDLMRRLARLGAEEELAMMHRKARELEQAFPGIKQSFHKRVLKANLEKARAARKIAR